MENFRDLVEKRLAALVEENPLVSAQSARDPSRLEVTLRGTRDGGFDVVVATKAPSRFSEESLLVRAEVDQLRLSFAEWDVYPDEADAIADACVGVVRDLLGPSARVIADRADGRTVSLTGELLVGDRWVRQGAVVRRRRSRGARSREVLQNRFFAARTALAPRIPPVAATTMVPLEPAVSVRVRPLTEEERRLISGAADEKPRGLWHDLKWAAFAAFFTYFPILGALLALGRWIPALRDDNAVGIVTSPLGLLVFAWVFIRARASSKRDRSSLESLRHIHERELREGTAEVTRYRVVDAIQVEEYEDEGSHYFLLLEDGRVLYESGQHLYELEALRRFPSTIVEIHSTSHVGRLLDVKGVGDYLPPSALLPPFADSVDLPASSIVEVDFEAIRRGEAFPTAPRTSAHEPSGM